MKKTTLVSLLVAGLLISPAVLAQHVQADQVSNTTTEEAVAPPMTELEATETVGSTQGDNKITEQPEKVEEALEYTQPTTPPTTPTPERHEEPAASPAEVDTRTVDSTLSHQPNIEPATPTVSSGEVSATPKVSQGDLAKITGATVTDQDREKEVTVTEAVNQLLNWASTKENQVGTTDKDRLAFAKSLGMVKEGVEGSAPVTNLTSMVDVAKQLRAAYRADKKTPLFLNGKAQPIFPFTPGDDPEHYSYDKSDIVRYIVYVETDYDTDGDGKPDLVKTFVQVPKAAVNGDYKAASIFEASPYVTGTTEERTLEGIGLKEGGSFDMAKLYEKPAKRQASKTVTTEEVAKATDPKDWYYVNPRESSDDYTHYDYENLNWYNYYLVRGYAVVTSSGLG